MVETINFDEDLSLIAKEQALEDSGDVNEQNHLLQSFTVINWLRGLILLIIGVIFCKYLPHGGSRWICDTN